MPSYPSCKGCPLAQSGSGWVSPDGSGSNGILIVGEAPGAEEAIQGKPYVGPAGYYLDRLLQRAGLDREGFRIANVLSCRPPHNALHGEHYEASACSHCKPNLEKELKKGYKVIVALGNTALRELTGFHEITRYRGYVLQTPYGWVVPTFHPSYLLPRKGQANTSRFVGAVIRDLRKAVDIATNGFTRPEASYLLDPAPGAAWTFYLEYEEELRRNPDTYLSIDIETPYKLKQGNEEELEDDEDSEDLTSDPIIRVSFSFRERYAMSVPWDGPWMETIKAFMKAEGKKCGWNFVSFDLPIIKSNGLEVDGEIYDYMWGWHLVQSALPKGLESVTSYFAPHITPWKHLSHSQPAYYNAIDADAALCNAIGIERELKAAGQWETFIRHNVKLDPILLEIGREHGVRIDVEKQNILKDKLEGRKLDLLNEVQALVPKELFKWKVYQRNPNRPSQQEFQAPMKIKTCSICGEQLSSKSKHMKGKCKKGTVIVSDGMGIKWRVPEEWNPNSTDQLKDYVSYRKHPIGRDRKTKRASLSRKHVEKLAAKYKDRIYQIALELRGVSKTLGTYVNGLKPDKHGLIYTTYSHKPSTGRLSSSGVNLQNISHRGSAYMAKEVRETIVPPAGHMFVEADSSAIEAVMTGWFMGDKDYIELAKRGIHDYLTCLELGIDFWTADLGKLKKDPTYKAIRDRNKMVVHASSYGMKPNLMTMLYPEAFPTAKAAIEAQEKFFTACPNVKKWQEAIRSRAHKETYLTNPWGYRGYFYNVFAKDKNGKITYGDDANKCVAFLPQGSAGCFCQDNILEIWDRCGVARRKWIPANHVVHDSYLLQCPEEEVDWAMNLLELVLTRPIPQMGGLRVGCEISVGPNWAEMEVRKVVRV